MKTQMEPGLLYNLPQGSAAAKDWTDAANNDKNTLMFKQILFPLVFNNAVARSVNIYLVQPTATHFLFS